MSSKRIRTVKHVCSEILPQGSQPTKLVGQTAPMPLNWPPKAEKIVRSIDATRQPRAARKRAIPAEPQKQERIGERGEKQVHPEGERASIGCLAPSA